MKKKKAKRKKGINKKKNRHNDNVSYYCKEEITQEIPLRYDNYLQITL